MKIRPKFDHWLPKRLKVAAITIYPWIFYTKEKRFLSARIRIHEREHISQVEDMSTAWGGSLQGIPLFYLSYFLYYLAGLIRYRSHNEAYWFIPYEIESRDSEHSH